MSGYRPVALTDATVSTAVDLSGTVTASFVCRDCTFKGDVNASGVTFDGTVDLSGSTFHGNVDFHESLFREPALFATPPARVTTFRRGADFELAQFVGLASFEQADFWRGPNFTLAHFASDAIFANASFACTEPGACGKATFERTYFVRAVFGGGLRRGHVQQPGVLRPIAIHPAGRFRSVVVFPVGELQLRPLPRRRQLREHHVRLQQDMRPDRGDSPVLCEFQYASVSGAGGLDFDFAKFNLPAQFDTLTSSGAITLADTTFTNESVVTPPSSKATTYYTVMTDLFTPNLVMAVDDVHAYVEPSDREYALQLIESSAQAQGDLGVANQALYARELVSRAIPGGSARWMSSSIAAWRDTSCGLSTRSWRCS